MYSLASSQLRVSYAGGSCFWLFCTFRCPGVDCVAMRSAEQMDGQLETAILGGAAKLRRRAILFFLTR